MSEKVMLSRGSLVSLLEERFGEGLKIFQAKDSEVDTVVVTTEKADDVYYIDPEVGIMVLDSEGEVCPEYLRARLQGRINGDIIEDVNLESLKLEEMKSYGVVVESVTPKEIESSELKALIV